MDTGIVIVQDGEDVLVHCQRCGLSCQIPQDLRAKALDDFYRGHRRDIEVAAHHKECPAWAVRTVIAVP